MRWDVGFFCWAPVAMLFRQMKWLIIPWIVLVFYLPIKSGALPYPYDRALFSASLFGAFCLHVWVGAYWYRGPLRYAQRLIAKADRFRIFDPDLRWRFLSGRSPDGTGMPMSRWASGRKCGM